MPRFPIITATTLLFLCASPLTAAEPKPETAAKKAAEAELTFHESWTAPQRADLQRMHRLLKVDVPASMLQALVTLDAINDIINAEHPNEISEKAAERAIQKAMKECSLADRLAIRAAINPMLRVLRNTAKSGRGNVYNKNGLSVAYLAVRFGMPDLAKELVRRGADPNQRYDIGEKIEGSRAYQDLVVVTVARSPLCETATLTAEQAEELLEWLLSNGADPRQSHLPMLMLCCRLEMQIHGSCTCSAMVLERLESLPAEWQALLAGDLLGSVPGSWPVFEKLYNKGIFTRQGTESEVGFLHQVITGTTADTPQKTEKLLALGFNPNQEDENGNSPLRFLMSTMQITEDEQELNLQLQCLEVLLKGGATDVIYDYELPENRILRDKITTLLRQYNISVLTEDEEEEEADTENYEEE